MKALFIGGTGTISTDVVALAQQRGWEITLLNRGSKKMPEGIHSIIADINDEEAVAKAIALEHYDVVAQFIGYTAEDVKRDIRLFQNKTRQYIFISSASAYQKPLTDYRITESTPLVNPYWQYSRNKIEAEEVLMSAYRTSGFPVTIVRPSHTYNGTKPPVAVHGDKGNWQILKRILDGVVFDNSKIKRLVPDFICHISMADGLRQAVHYMLSHPETQTPDPEFDSWCDRIANAISAADKAF